MNHTDVTRVEVADRLRAIGRMGEHTTTGKISPQDAVDLAEALVKACRRHLEHKDT